MLTLRNLPKSGLSFLIGAHYCHMTYVLLYSIKGFPQLPAASQISALAWHTRHKSEHLSMVARIVVNSGVYLVPRPEIVLGPGGGGRLLA